jgi:glycosyltransferase involved in cell wall biosynthesis
MDEQVWPTVAVIMPVLNEAAYIERSLGAVLAQDYPADRLEILVVDGGSTDATRPIVRELMARHRHLHFLSNPRRIQAAAMNIGIEAAHGDIIVRVDGHTFIAPDYVSACVRHLRTGEAANVGGMMRPVGSSYVGQGIALATASPFGIGGSRFHYSDREQWVDTVYLGAYWRQSLLELGGFDETLAINEDYELNYRLRRGGGKILLSPAVQSTYACRDSLPELGRQYFRYGRWKVRTLQKHPASLRWRQVVAPLLIVVLGVSALVGLVWRPARWVLGLAGGAYLLANFAASVITAKKGGRRFLPILPPVFALVHFAWGTGFWVGWLKVGINRD